MANSSNSLQSISSRTLPLQKTSRVLFYLFALSTLMSQSAMDLFAGLFGICVIFQLFFSQGWRGLRDLRLGWEPLILLWFAWTLVSLLMNLHTVPHLGWAKLADFRWMILSLLIGWHLLHHPWSLKKEGVLSIFLMFGSLYALLVFILKYDPLFPDRAMDVFDNGIVRTGGFLQQPIVFAQLYALWFLFFSGVLITRILNHSAGHVRRLRESWFLALTLAVTGMALLLSFTRGVWISIALSLLLAFALISFRWFVVAFLSGSALTALLIKTWPLFHDRLFQALQGGDEERLWIWKANWRMFLDHPYFGVGHGHNSQLVKAYFDLVQAPTGLLESHAHNQFLQILVGLGVAGLFFYMGFWLWCLKTSLSELRAPKPSDPHPHHFAQRREWGLGTFMVVIGFLAGGLFEANYEHSKMRYALALFIGFLVYLRQHDAKDSES